MCYTDTAMLFPWIIITILTKYVYQENKRISQALSGSCPARNNMFFFLSMNESINQSIKQIYLDT